MFSGSTRHLVASLVFAIFTSGVAGAEDPIRIWVDASGRYSVEAALRMVKEDRVILVRRDGGQASMMIDQLSERDKSYIESYRQEQASDTNMLRQAPPPPPKIQPLERLDLPYAAFTAPEGSALTLGVASHRAPPTMLPKELSADPSPDQIPLPETSIEIDRVKSYDVCSRIVQVGTPQIPAMGISISSGFRVSGGANSGSRIVMFLPRTKTSRVVYRSQESTTILDHNVHSGRSLVLVGHTPLGDGGSLAIASGWERQEVRLDMLRALPQGDDRAKAPHLRWARWLDEDSLIAAIDDSLVGWNLTSGEPFFRINGIDRKSIPAISGGHRYVAVPTRGYVHLYSTIDGVSLGRIEVEPNAIAGVAFSRHGNALAISTPRRMRVWDLTAASLVSNIESRSSLGIGAPVWINSDLVMSGSGVMISLFRGLPVWRYEFTTSDVASIGGKITLLRKYPQSKLAVLKLPHYGAEQAIEWIDSIPKVDDLQSWQVPGRSTWDRGAWKDRDTRISRRPTLRR